MKGRSKSVSVLPRRAVLAGALAAPVVAARPTDAQSLDVSAVRPDRALHLAEAWLAIEKRRISYFARAATRKPG